LGKAPAIALFIALVLAAAGLDARAQDTGTQVAVSRAQGARVREPRDSVGFCWDAKAMRRFISRLDSLERADAARTEAAVPVVAAISPHDDYLYAGRLYRGLFRRIRAKEAVIFGVTHGIVRREIGDPQGVLLLDDFDAWTVPGGSVRVSALRDRIRAGLDSSLARVDARAHEREHSIEALLPFLAHDNPEVRITPIMVTAMPFERMQTIADTLAGIIAAYMRERGLVPGRDIVFLVSSDANHYGRDFGNLPFGETAGAHARGSEQDRSIADELAAGRMTTERIRALFDRLKTVLWCGRYSVPFGLLATMRTLGRAPGSADPGGATLRGRVLCCTDTYSEGALPALDSGMGTTAPASLQHWVGLVSIAFTLDP
jgi:AmmeMemoRadiSam system protein B